MKNTKTDTKSIYFLLVKCWEAGDMRETQERLQGLLAKKLSKKYGVQKG